MCLSSKAPMLGLCAFGRSAVQHQWPAYRAALHAAGTAPARRGLFACRASVWFTGTHLLIGFGSWLGLRLVLGLGLVLRLACRYLHWINSNRNIDPNLNLDPSVPVY